MKVWEVESRWSKQFVKASCLLVACNKYVRQAKKELNAVRRSLRCSPEPTAVRLVGEAI